MRFPKITRAGHRGSQPAPRSPSPLAPAVHFLALVARVGRCKAGASMVLIPPSTRRDPVRHTRGGHMADLKTCEHCEHAHRYGWWGPRHKGTHCRRCHLSWTARAQQHCTVCCSHFSSESAANLHWGSGESSKPPAYAAKHLDPRDVAKLSQDEFRVWRMAGERPFGLHGLRTEATNEDQGSDVPMEAA